MTKKLLRMISASEIESSRFDPLDEKTLGIASEILAKVKERGDTALRDYAEKFGDIETGESLIVSKEELKSAFDSLTAREQEVLKNTSERISNFAKAQRDSLSELSFTIPGGEAGHKVFPLDSAGCYAPGGRFPLPSSVLMTALSARAAGVRYVCVASPKPTPVTLAAAHVARADAFLQVGGAQAIAAFAYGVGGVEQCDVIVGPGNRFVTAAKQLVSGKVKIDMLAGPSELVVIADESASASTIAADLLAQAEHDTDALPILVSTSEALVREVEKELQTQLETLPTRETAEAALGNGYVILAKTLNEAAEISNQISPEHLEVLVEDPVALGEKLTSYGGIFLGENSAEVLGDYGAGPNHVLPTGGTARQTGGLSVFDFLRVHTWLRVDDLSEAKGMVEDAVGLARLEGLEAHARSAEKRLPKN